MAGHLIPDRGMLCFSRLPMARALSDRLLHATFKVAKLRNSVCFAKLLLPEMTSDAVVPANKQIHAALWLFQVKWAGMELFIIHTLLYNSPAQQREAVTLSNATMLKISGTKTDLSEAAP